DRPRALDGHVTNRPYKRRRRGHAHDPRAGGRGPAGGHPLLLHARPPAGVPGSRLRDLLRRQRHLQKRRRPGRGGAPHACRAAPDRDRRALPHPPGGAQAPQPARLRGVHGCLHRRATRHLAGRAGRHGRAQRRTRLRMVSARPGGRPSRSDGRATRRSRDLGQNFLRDPNILGVIGRESELSARDVVLEVGGGEGVLSAYLAPLVNWVHVAEIDERLRPTLEERLGGFENVALWWGDAMRLDLHAMEPKPTKMVANLPYGIAAGVLLRTIEELDGIQMWVVMVQREVGERLAAG